MYIVYQAKNKINHKSYIGFTGQNFNKRINHHKHCAFSKKLDFKFSRALRKYGNESFEWNILFKTNDRTEALNQEKQLIIEFDSLNNGYNSNEGGLAPVPTQQSIQKSRLANLGRKLTIDHRKKLSESHKGKSAWNKGIPSKRKTPTFTKQWMITWPDNRTTIINNLQEFCRCYNLHRSTLERQIRGELHTYKGYKCQKYINTQDNKESMP